MTVGIALAFVVVMLVFVVYDIFVKRRNSNLVLSSARNNALITSMFPRHIRDQMLQQKAKERSKKQARRSLTKSDKMKGFLNGSDQLENEDKSSKPLAELYLETTVAFCDIAGFTAWSSTRYVRHNCTKYDQRAPKVSSGLTFCCLLSYNSNFQ